MRKDNVHWPRNNFRRGSKVYNYLDLSSEKDWNGIRKTVLSDYCCIGDIHFVRVEAGFPWFIYNFA